MNWVFLALLANIIWAPTNIVDKVLATKYYKNYFSLVFIAGLISAIMIFIYSVITHGFVILLLTTTVITLLAGLIRIISYIFYFKATFYEEASRIAILFQIAPILTLILSFCFLAEKLNIYSYLAFISLILAGVLSSIKFDNLNKKIKVSAAFWDMFICVSIGAISAVVIKHTLITTNYWDILPYLMIGECIGIILVSLFIKCNPLKDFFATSTKAKLLLIISEVINSIAFIIYIVALSIGSVSIISALCVINPIFVFFLAVILSYWWPKVIKEQIDRQTILLKISAIILVGVGIYLLNF